MYDWPFMEYFIFHVSWLNNVNEYNDGGLNVKGIVNTKLHYVFGTIGMRIYFVIRGRQGGGVNDSQDGVNLSPNIGLSWLQNSFGSMVVVLCLALSFLFLREF